MALLTTQTVAHAGAVPTYTAVSASDTFAPGPNTFLHVKNGGGSSTNVTLVATGVDPTSGESDLLLRDRVVAVANASEKMIPLGPSGASKFRNPSTGVVTVTFSVTASVTVAVIDMP